MGYVYTSGAAAISPMGSLVLRLGSELALVLAPFGARALRLVFGCDRVRPSDVVWSLGLVDSSSASSLSAAVDCEDT